MLLELLELELFSNILWVIVKRGACQGDPVSAYLFILVLQIACLSIKKYPEIKGTEIFKHCFLYTPYADDTTFFLREAIHWEAIWNI